MGVEAIQALDRRNVVNQAVRDALGNRILARISGDDAVDVLVEFAVRNDGIYRRDIGRLLTQYAPTKGAAGFLDMLNDDDRKAPWQVAIDALAELSQHQVPEQTLLVA